MDPVTLAILGGGAAISLGESIFGGMQRNKALKEAQSQLANMPHYQIPTAVTNRVGTAASMLNAENPAANQLYSQILRNNATLGENAQKNAVSGAAALGVQSAATANTTNALPQIAELNTQYKQQNLNNYYGALDALSQEQRMKQQMEMERQQQLLNFSLGKAGAGSAMLGQGMSSLTSILSNPYLLSGGNTGWGQKAVTT